MYSGLEFVRKQLAAIDPTTSSSGGSGEREQPSDAHQRVIFVDVDAKDSTTGIMFPPQSFLTREFMETLYGVLHPQGVHQVVNLSTA